MAEAFDAFEKGQVGMSPFTAAAISNQTIQESMRLILMVRAYQVGKSCGPRRGGGRGGKCLLAHTDAPPVFPFHACSSATPGAARSRPARLLPAAPPLLSAPLPAPPQVAGHAASQLDPLGLDARPVPPELEPSFWGFKDTDMDRE